MSDSIDNWTLQGLKNPQLLQSMILDRFEESTDGKYAIVDGNNVAAFLIENFASIAAKSIQKIDDSVLPAAYPSRAVSMTDLYKHLSDYDYLGVFASPSTCAILLIVEKDYLMQNAVEVVNEDGSVLYKKVIIPQSARFKIGSYTFGLYYPIEIRVSDQTGMFTVLYDTTVKNPLHILSQNVLECNFRRQDTMNLAYIKIPVYQFNTSTSVEPLVNGTGYRRVIPYTDKFYALKVTGEMRDPTTDTWSEQEYQLALSGRSYNPENPTVVFTVDPANNQVILEIPYVYFTENRIRGNIHVDIYTTSGYLNYQIPDSTEELVNLDFFSIPLDTEIQKFVEPFRTMPTLAAVPVTMKIVGGTDGMSYADLRRKVLTDAFGDKTLQTPADVDSYFKNEGYVTSLYKDGITDRIFNAHVTLRNDDDSIVAAGSVGTLFDMNTLMESNTRTIIPCDNMTYTILPSTRYKFDASRGICVPLTDLELDQLNRLSAADKVAAFNSNIFTLSPFHLQVSLKDKYPTTATYDLGDAEIESREYLTSRDVSQHLSLNTAVMKVVPVNSAESDDRVTDKYNLEFRILRSGLGDFDAVTTGGGTNTGLKQLRVIVGLKKIDNGYVFAEATYQGRKDDTDVFTMDVAGTAVFNQIENGHTVRIKSPFSDSGVDVYLTTEMRVMLCVRGTIDYLDETYPTKEHPYRWLETDYITGSNLEEIGKFVALSEHRLNLRFGKLVNELDQRIALVYSGIKYKTYSSTKLLTLETAIYEVDDDGVPTYHTNPDTGKVELDVKYPKGTLTCFTAELKDESMILTRFLAANLKNCQYIDPDDPSAGYLEEPLPPPNGNDKYWDFSATSGSPTHLLRLLGRAVTVESHVVPRFTIPLAKTTKDGDSPILGQYELNKADDTSRGSLSHSTDEWFHTVSSKADDGVTRYIDNYRVTGTDTLAYVVGNILQLPSGATNPAHVLENTQVDEIRTFREGMFVLIQNDTSSNTPPEGVDLVDENRTDYSDHPTKLYLRWKDQWVCLLSCNSYNHLVDLVTTIRTGYVKPDKETTYLNNKRYYRLTSGEYVLMTKNVDYTVGGSIASNVYVCRPWSYGYSYLLSRVERGSYKNGVYEAWSEFKQAEDRVEYLSFLTTNADGTPNFKPRERVIENEDGSIATDLSADNVWMSEVDLWPWEAKTWNRLKLTYSEGFIKYDDGVFLETDSMFETQFDKARMSKYCLHISGQVQLNKNGEPEADEDSKREVQYLVNMLQIDAKLAETTAAKQSLAYPSNLVETMRTHFENLGSVKNRLYTNTKLYFEPMKSLGLAEFYTDGDSIKEHNLDITMGFRLHVSSDIAEDTNMMETLKESIIKLIDEHMSSGSTSLTTIAQLIKDANADSVRYVDVLGIDGDETLQTLRCVESEVKPHLKHELRLLDDGATIDLTRGLNLEFVVADV